tara:strand:- start:158 stop:439 length:282 start_codon:yes stop_codon:yes gene_type:complete
MKEKLATPCCNAGYEKDEVSYCCQAKISDSGLCYSCHDHTESEGYICDECEDWLDERDLVEKVYKCGFCGEELNDDNSYCSKECSVADNTERV